MNSMWLLFVLAFGADCVLGQAQTTAQQVPPNCVCNANAATTNNNGGGKQKCRSDNGQPITNYCQFKNELATNPNLGIRPCAQSTTNTNDFNSQRTATVCLTNGQTFTGPQAQLQTQLNSTPGLGVRCKNACPCTLTCGGPGQGQGGRGGSNGFGGRG